MKGAQCAWSQKAREESHRPSLVLLEEVRLRKVFHKGVFSYEPGCCWNFLGRGNDIMT